MKFKPVSEDARSFVKLEAEKSIQGVFRGEPYDFRAHYLDRRGIKCTGENCELCLAGNKSKFRFRINFITKQDDKYVAKVFEQGLTVYKQMSALQGGGYDLERSVVKITRHGSGLDTEYSIIPIANGSLTPEKEKEVAAVELNSLDHQTPSETEPPSTDLDNIPF